MKLKNEIMGAAHILRGPWINPRDGWNESQTSPYVPPGLCRKTKINIYTLAVSTSLVSSIVKATVSGVFENLKFKISEGSDQN